jgi:hypothetical protein
MKLRAKLTPQSSLKCKEHRVNWRGHCSLHSCWNKMHWEFGLKRQRKNSRSHCGKLATTALSASRRARRGRGCLGACPSWYSTRSPCKRGGCTSRSRKTHTLQYSGALGHHRTRTSLQIMDCPWAALCLICRSIVFLDGMPGAAAATCLIHRCI